MRLCRHFYCNNLILRNLPFTIWFSIKTQRVWNNYLIFLRMNCFFQMYLVLMVSYFSFSRINLLYDNFPGVRYKIVWLPWNSVLLHYHNNIQRSICRRYSKHSYWNSFFWWIDTTEFILHSLQKCFEWFLSKL